MLLIMFLALRLKLECSETSLWLTPEPPGTHWMLPPSLLYFIFSLSHCLPCFLFILNSFTSDSQMDLHALTPTTTPVVSSAPIFPRTSFLSLLGPAEQKKQVLCCNSLPSPRSYFCHITAQSSDTVLSRHLVLCSVKRLIPPMWPTVPIQTSVIPRKI